MVWIANHFQNYKCIQSVLFVIYLVLFFFQTKYEVQKDTGQLICCNFYVMHRVYNNHVDHWTAKYSINTNNIYYFLYYLLMSQIDLRFYMCCK